MYRSVAAKFFRTSGRVAAIVAQGKTFHNLLSLVNPRNPAKAETIVDRIREANLYCLSQKPDEEGGGEVPRRQSLKCKMQSR
jgi:hypothetical protein